ncbi:efflux RND transporter periplasmic adaptor subunit [Aestuariivirga litoralis]|uniref:efflux RND transporter periplasmic adaptor subunit n=1 Tax=Aestuariivirga litoralis TaxID=2650924 RepID=UPI0018C51C12|nr:HlyD family efflux transporter periplasmic adaptor subunit [Aestuariivirga litoralis]
MQGVIASVSKAEGDTVTRGKVVAELANDDLKALVAQAQSSVDVAAARLALVEKGPRPQEVARAQAQFKEEQSNANLFEVQLRRREVLAQKGAISQEQLDEARRSLAASQQRMAAAQQQFDILKQGSRREEIVEAKASYNLVVDKLTEAQASLAKSQIKSTIDGVVLRQYLHPGEALATQTGPAAIMQIADTSHLKVRVQIDENDISGLKIGQKAKIMVPALRGKTLGGTITSISPRLGAKTVTANAATEKRDTRVLKVIVTLPAGVQLPVNLRVDVVIDLDSVQQPAELRVLTNKKHT